MSKSNMLEHEGEFYIKCWAHEAVVQRTAQKEYAKGYLAGTADSTGQPLTTLEQLKQDMFINGQLEAINWLMLNGHLPAAQALNQMMMDKYL